MSSPRLPFSCSCSSAASQPPTWPASTSWRRCCTAVVREWGRLGSWGRRRLDLYEARAQASEALESWLRRKLRRGYETRASRRLTSGQPMPLAVAADHWPAPDLQKTYEGRAKDSTPAPNPARGYACGPPAATFVPCSMERRSSAASSPPCGASQRHARQLTPGHLPRKLRSSVARGRPARAA